MFVTLLILATFLCSLVAGLLFAFAVVVMPGIRRLDDDAFVRVFQAIDGVIQNNQPLFLLVWVGSILALVGVTVLGVWSLTGADRVLLIAAAMVYVLCVQVPTMAVNVPLNNRLQTLEPDAMDEGALRRARTDFESRWNRWNAFRTVGAGVTSLLLLLLLFAL